MLRFASIKKKRTRIFHFSRTREMLLEPQLHWEPDALLFISHASARCYLAFRQKCRKSCGFHFSRQREMLPGCNPLTAVSRTLSFLTHARDVTATLSSLVPYKVSYSFARLVIFTSHGAYKIGASNDVHLGFARRIL